MSNSQSSSWLPNLKVTKITTLPASATFLRATAWYLERSTTQETKCLKTLLTYPKQQTPTRSQVTKWSLLGKPPTRSTPKDTWALATATSARFLCGIYSRTWLPSLQAAHLGSFPPVVSLQPMMQASLTSFTWASANCWSLQVVTKQSNSGTPSALLTIWPSLMNTHLPTQEEANYKKLRLKKRSRIQLLKKWSVYTQAPTRSAMHSGVCASTTSS